MFFFVCFLAMKYCKIILAKFSFFILFSFFVMLFTNCSNDKSSDSTEDEQFLQSSAEIQESSSSTIVDIPELKPDTSKNFIYLSASSKKATLGTDDETARFKDHHSMDVLLNYNFYMGKHEATRAEYCELMNCKYSKDSANYPQVNITYYDVVLFANALSKKNHYDTVYTYNKAEFDSDGKCFFLENLVVHYDHDGFRLPTEAEWIYAASQQWAPAKSWNADNSNHSAHEVCTAPGQDSTAFCDMEGNVMEWVGDWSGKLFDTTITDYAGAPSPNVFAERVLKGGSFNNEIIGINMFARSDVYTVTSTSQSDYVGFRLARGVIPNVTFLNAGGSSINVVINTLATTSDVSKIAGTKKVKLVFRNDITGNLAFVYYRDGETAVEIADTIDSYHPDISPDGKYVAFCTKAEGTSGKSSLYVRKIDESGSGLVKLDVESAAIPRFRVLPDGDTVIVYVTDADINSNLAKWKSYSTWQVPFSAGQFGTPQKLFDGSYNGGVSENGQLAVSGARLLRSRIEGEEKVWYNGEQACNVSLSTDGTSRTLFLDFAGKTGQKFVGETYKTHQRILVADSNGTLLSSIASPSGYTFDHSEWVRNANLSVATLTNVNGAHEKIVLIDMENGTVVNLVESEELWHPSMWIDHANPRNIKSSSSSKNEERSTKSSSSLKETSSSSSAKESSSTEEQSSSSKVVVKSSSSSLQSVSLSSEKNSSSSSIQIAPSSSENSSSSSVIQVNTSSSEKGSSSSEEKDSSSSENSSSSLESSSSSSSIEPVDEPDLIYTEFDEDSAGIYSKSGSAKEDLIMRYKMELLWQYKNESNVVVIGSSRPMDAVISNNFSEQFNVVNLAQTPNSIYGSRDFFKNYIYKHFTKMKYLIISLDIDFWYKNSATDNFFYSSYQRYEGYIYDKKHNYWEGYNTDGLWQASMDSPGSSQLDFYIEEKGRYSIDTCAKNWVPVTYTNEKEFDTKASMNVLKEIIEMSAQRNITVIGVIFPMSPKFKETKTYGRYGLLRTAATGLIEDLKNLETVYSNFVFFDENKFGDHDYTSNMFVDVQHLCPEGAKVITSRLDSLLQSLEH